MRFSVITVASAIATVGSVSAFAAFGSSRNTAFAPASLLNAAKSQYSSLEDKVLKSAPVAATPAKASSAPATKAAPAKVAPAPAPVAKAPPAPVPVAAKPAPVVQATTTADASVIPTGIAVGAVPLVLAPLVLLSAGRDTLTKTKARRDELYEQIEKFEKAQQEAKNRKVDTSVDAGGLVKALGTLGAGVAALGLIITSPFTDMEGPKFEAPKLSLSSGTKTVISAPVSKISKPIDLKSAPPGYNFDITPIDKNAPPPPPPKQYVGAYYLKKVTKQDRTREPVGPAGPYYLKKRPTPPPAPPKPVPAPVAPATPYYLKSKASAPAIAPKVAPKAAPAPEVTTSSRKNEKIATVSEGAEEKKFAEKVVADKAAREAADAEAKAKAAEKAAAEAEKKLAEEKAAADKAAAEKLAVEQLEAKQAAEQAERAKAEAEKVAAEKAAAAKAIADAEKEAAAAKPAPVATETKPAVTGKASSKESLSPETLQLLKKYNKK